MPPPCKARCARQLTEVLDFRRIFESAPGLFLILRPDEQFSILGASDAYLAATLTTRTGIVGRGVFEVFPDNPEAPQANATRNLRASLEKVVRSKAPDTMPVQKYDIRRPESQGGGFEERFWTPVNSPVLSSQGELLYIVHRVEDVTEITRRRRDLDEANQRLRLLQAGVQQERTDLANLFQQTPVPTAVVKGPELIFEMANPAYLAVVGGRDIVGKPLLEALPEARGQGFDELLREVMRTGQPHIGHETPVRLERDGSVEERCFTFIYAPLRGAGGEVERAIAIVNEVTEQVQARKQIERLAAEATAELAERKRAQAALGQSEGKYRTLFESMDEGFCVVEVMFDELGAASDYRFVEVNPAFERHTGLVNATGRTARELVPGHDEFWFTTYGSVALTGNATRFEHYAAAMGRWFDVFCTRIGPARERKVAILFNDITKRKAAEAALKEADRRKDEFLATLAHELRNPLAPIRNAVNLLQQADGDALVRQRAQSILARQVDHIIRLVDDLLDIARVSRGRISLQRQAVRLDAVIESAVETSRPLIEAGGHRLSIELPQEPVVLCADALRLAQVIANLLNNAARYTPHAGRIAVTARIETGWVSVAVQDDGIGIEPASLPRLFEMFGRVEGARQRVPGGLGIGLALARQLVELHGGRIEARSRGTGLGSEFIVRLPTLDAAPALAAPVPAEPASSQTRRILVVDDNMDAAAALGMVLEQMGHAVAIAHDGASALVAARQDPPEVILADLDLPGLDGFGLATRLREDRRFDRVPIIAVSGFGQDGDRKRTRQAGFDEHLVKPVDAGVLHAALQLIDWKTL